MTNAANELTISSNKLRLTAEEAAAVEGSMDDYEVSILQQFQDADETETPTVELTSSTPTSHRQRCGGLQRLMSSLSCALSSTRVSGITEVANESATPVTTPVAPLPSISVYYIHYKLDRLAEIGQKVKRSYKMGRPTRRRYADVLTSVSSAV
ncbi:MAG: hypothetical protein M1816_001342 [Peltula sp. TS41687]|nr:MAG: hypothetical protein M1816_001342 [Peltula sp. TS41687]